MTTTRFDQGFETGIDGLFDGTNGWHGSITVTTGGVGASDGTSYAILDQTGTPGVYPTGDPNGATGPFTRFDGYRALSTNMGVMASVDVFLDPNAWSAGEGFDYSVAANDQTNTHLQDFIFHVTQDTSTGNLQIGASNNTNFDPREDLETLGNFSTISTAGWYTFTHTFQENGSGNLEVVMSVTEKGSGTVVYTETIEASNGGSPVDFDTGFGGNRYGWFTNIDVAGGIAVDNLSLESVDMNPVQLSDGGAFVSTHATIQDAVDAALAGYIVVVDAGDYSGEAPITVNVEDLTIDAPAGATGIEVVLGNDGVNDIVQINVNGGAEIGITGNAADNQILGGAGANSIAGLGGDDFLFGDGGDNQLFGGAGNDTVNGSSGNDTVDGGAGDDVLSGGDGEDLFVPGSAIAGDVIYGGDGDDTVDYSAETGILTVDISAGTVTRGGGAVDTLDSIENLIGGSGGLSITGTAAGEFIGGSDAADSIDAGGGNDTIEGGLGNDTIDGGAGIDIAQIDDNNFMGFDLADYTFSSISVVGGVFSGTIDGPSGVDVIEGIEVLQVTNTGSSTFIVTPGMSIQAAINAASAGDTIVLQAGTHTENNITVDKELTIQGQGSGGTTVLDAAGGNGFVITAAGAAADVTFEDMDIINPSGSGVVANSGSTVDRVVVDNVNISGAGTNAVEIRDNGANDVHVLNSDFVNNGSGTSAGDGALSFFQYNNDATIQNVTVTGNGTNTSTGSQTGIQFRGDVGDLGTVLLDNVTVDGMHGRQPIGIFNYDQIDGLTFDTVVINSDSTGFGVALNIDGVGGDVDLNNEFGPGAKFINSSAPNLAANGDVLGVQGDNTANVLGGSDDTDFIRGFDGDDQLRGNLGDDVILGFDRTGAVDSDTDTASFSGSFTAYTVTFTSQDLGFGPIPGAEIVGPDGTDFLGQVEKLSFDSDTAQVLLVGSGGYATLQAAVDDAAAGDTILVAAGSYDEVVTINKALTISGQGGAPGDVDVAGFVIDPAAVNGAADTLTLENMALDPTLSAAGTTGLRFNGDFNDTALGTLVLRDLTNEVDGGGAGYDQAGMLINGGGAGFNLEIENTSLSGNGANRTSGGAGEITVFEFLGDLTITNVDLTGNTGTTPNTSADNGLQISGFEDVAGTGSEATTNPSGAITIDGLTISGQYGKVLATIQGYSDLEGLSFNNTTLGSPTSATGWTALHINQPLPGGNAPSIGGINDVDLTGISFNGGSYPNFFLPGDGGAFITDYVGQDSVIATSGDDIFFAGGTGGDDTVDMGAGDDFVSAGIGDDDIDGGADTDTAAYAGASTEYTIGVTTDENGRVTGFTSVTDDVTAGMDEGTDTLTSIEQLVFANNSVNPLDATVLDLSQDVQMFDASGDLIGTFDTLKEAVDAAAGGETIKVAAGSFNSGDGSQIVVDVDLTIEGAGKTATTILADFNTGTGGDTRGWFVVEDGVTLNVSDIAFDGNGFDIWQAFRHKGAGTFDNVAFNDIEYQETGSPYAGTAIAAFTIGGTGEHVDVTNSMFTDIGRIGVQFFGAGTTGLFQNNMYTGKGVGDFLDYAVEVGGGATADILDNTITDNLGEALSDGSSSAGVLITTFFAAGTQATISGNTLTDNTLGIAVGFDGVDTSDVTIGLGNVITGGLVGLSVNGDAVVDGVANLTGTGSTVDWDGGAGGNAISGASLGDELSGGDGNDTIEAGPGDDTIDGGAGIDIARIHDAAPAGGFDLGDYTFSSVSVVGGVFSGTIDGPSGVDVIEGIEVLEVTNTGSSTFIVTAGMSIQAAIDAASAGDTIVIEAGDYNENIVIDKALTLEGAVDGSGDPAVEIGTGSGNAITVTAGAGGNVTLNNLSTDSGSIGISVAFSAVLDSLNIDNADIANTTQAGFSLNGATGVQAVSVTNSEFSGNGSGGANGSGDIIFFDYAGDITLSDLLMTGSTAAIPNPGVMADVSIQITGRDDTDYDVDQPIGTVAITNVTVNDNYDKWQVLVQGYNDLSGLTFTNVDLTGATRFGDLLFIDPISTSGQGVPGTPGQPGDYVGVNAGVDVALDLSDVTVTNLGAGATESPFGFTTPSVDVRHRGSDADDIVTGTSARDLLGNVAEGNNDFGGDDEYYGGASDDVLVGGAGNDTLDGGDDTDTAIFEGARSGYDITQATDANGFVTGFSAIEDTDTGPFDDGTDTLISVENLAFAGDGTVLALTDPVQLFDDMDNLIGTFTTIQDAVDAATDGADQTIRVSAGTYAESVDINKIGLTIEGAGVGSTTLMGSLLSDLGVPSGTPLNDFFEANNPAYSSSDGFTINADGVTITGFQVTGFAQGVRLNTTDNSSITGNQFIDNVNGIRKGTSFEVTNIDISNNVFTQGIYGMTVYAASSGAGSFDGVNLDMNTFSALSEKGIYVEQLSNATLDDNSFDDVGNYGRISPPFGGTNGEFGNAIDINLKYQTYSNVVFTDTIITNSGRSDQDGASSAGLFGGAIAVKTRDDAPSYSTNPADFTGQIVFNGGSIDGTSTAFRVGEPGKDNLGPDVLIDGTLILNATVADIDNATDPANGGTTTVVMDPAQVTLDASVSQAPVDITGNALANTVDAGSGDDSLEGAGADDDLDGGNGTDTAVYAGDRVDFTIADTRDADGLVTAFTGVTDGNAVGGDEGVDTLTSIERLSFEGDGTVLDLTLPVQLFDAADNLIGTFATIQDAVDGATDGAGQLIRVPVGTFAEDVTVNKGVTIEGVNEGLAGNNVGRGAESIVDGTITVGGSNPVVIDGFKFLNDDAGGNTVTVTSGGGHQITNNLFESTIAGGASGDRAIFTNVLATGSLFITDNLFAGDGSFSEADRYSSAAWDQGIWSNGGGADLTITGNVFQNTRTAINLENYSNANSLVDSNTFEDAGTGISIGNPTSGPLTTITNNTFQDVDTDFNARNLFAGEQIDLGATGNVALPGDADVYGGSPGGDGNIDDPLGTLVYLGGQGASSISGTSGADLITGDDPFTAGGGSNDTIMGQAGNDSLLGDDGADLIYGGDDEDAIDGQDGDDMLFGDAGNDSVNGGAGNDLVTGGIGNDTLDGGADIDTVSYEGRTEDITGVLNSAFAFAPAGGGVEVDLTSNFENLITGSGDDNVQGSSGSNTIWTNAGDDTVQGKNADDVIFGGAGNDTLFGQDGNDVLDGEGGEDSLSGGSSNDTLIDTGTTAGGTISANDTLDGGSGADLISAGAGDDIIYGGAAGAGLDDGDTIDGEAGSDVIYGGAGDDVVSDSGTDVGETDQIFGGLGADSISAGAGTDQVFGGEGIDTIDGGSEADQISGGDDGDSLAGGAGNDSITGDAGADLIYGGDGDDSVEGGSEADAIHGDAGNDTLDGGTADDALYGGANDDELTGGAGNDDLFGGDDVDVAVVDADLFSGGVLDFSAISAVNPGAETATVTTASDGTDSLTNVETVRFNDGSVHLFVNVDDNETTDEDSPAVIDVLANDTAVTGTTLDPTTVRLLDGSGNQVTTLNATDGGDVVGSFVVNTTSGEITFTAIADYDGAVDPVQYVAQDTAGVYSLPATLSVTITPLNDAPTTTPVAVAIDEDNEHTITLADFGFADDNDDSTLSNSTTARDELMNVIIEAIAVPGSLELNGVAINVTGGPVSVSRADIIAGLLTFDPAADTNDNTNTFSFDYRVQDDGGTPGVDTSALTTYNLTVNPVNDAPEITVPDTSTGNEVMLDEEATVAITGVSVADVDVEETGGTLTVTLVATRGTLAATDSGSATVQDNGTATIIVTGTSVGDINAVLATLMYTGDLNDNGDATITIDAGDGGASGTGGPLAASQQVVNLVIARINDTPDDDSTQANVSTDEDTTIAVGGLAFSDVDTGDTGAPAYGDVQITLTPASGTLAFGAAELGALTSSTVPGTAGDNVVLLGSLAAVNAALATMTYTPELNYSGIATVSYTFDDLGNLGGGAAPTTASGSFDVDVGAVNDAPVLVAPGAQSVNEDELTALDDFTLTDVDFVDGGGDTAEVVLGVTDGAITVDATGTGVTVTGNTSGSVTLTGNSMAELDTVLDTLEYQGAPDSNDADDGADLLTITVSDGGGTGTPGPLGTVETVVINRAAINDAPVLGVPVAQATDEDTAFDFATLTNPFSLSDVDLAETPGGFVTVTLSVDAGGVQGTLMATAQGGGTNTGAGEASVTGNGTGSVIIEGEDLAAVVAAMNSLVFDPAANANGTATIDIAVDDNGNTGADKSGLDPQPVSSVDIAVDAVNDAPDISATDPAAVNEDEYVAISTFTLADLDLTETPGGLLTVTLSVDETLGDITVTAQGTATATPGNSGGQDTIVIEGAVIADIQDTLNTLIFDPADDVNGPVQITAAVTDNGNTGADPNPGDGTGEETDVQLINITLNSVNDAPEGTDATITVQEDTARLFTSADFGFTDPADAGSVDGANNFEAVNITTLPAVGTGALEFFDGSIWTAVTAGQRITTVDIDAGNFRYSPGPQNAHGAAYTSFTFAVEDDGTPGDGTGTPPHDDIDDTPNTLTIDLDEVNDAPEYNAGGTTTGQVTEIADGAPGEGTQPQLASGSVFFTDVDRTTPGFELTLAEESHTVTVSSTPQVGDEALGDYVGSMSANVVAQVGQFGPGFPGLITWNYSVSDGALESLNDGEMVTQTYTLTLTDRAGTGLTDTQSVTITLVGENDGPEAANVSASTDEDTSVTFDLLGSDLDDENDQSNLIYTILNGEVLDGASNNYFDAVTITPTGELIFDPTAGANAGILDDLDNGESLVLTFSYTATDDQGATSSAATGTITVNGVTDNLGATFFGGSTPELFEGTAGLIDTVDYSSASVPTSGLLIFLSGAEGDTSLGTGGYASGDQFISIENIVGTGFDDIIISFQTGDLVNVFYGGGGNDFLLGGSGEDELFGGSGDDFLDGADGGQQDLLDGGIGIDVAQYSQATTGIVYDFNDPGAVTNSGEILDDILVSIEGVYGAVGFSNTLTGDGGDNILGGGNQADTLIGNGGNDVLVGFDGDDVIEGGAGLDILSGLGGTNTLTGGLGADTFLIETTTGTENITDFSTAEADLILFAGTGAQFSDLVFATNGTGVDVTVNGLSGVLLTVENITVGVLNDTDNFSFV